MKTFEFPEIEIIELEVGDIMNGSGINVWDDENAGEWN